VETPNAASTLEGGRLIQLDGTTTKYRDAGSGDAVLLIHGSSPGLDGEFAWAPVLPELQARFRTIVPDAPGYGESDMLAVADTPENVGRHLVQLLDQIGVDKVAVVGHSRGGRVAVEIAAGIRDRVTRLAIVCSGSVAPQGHVSDDGKYTGPATAILAFGADGDSSFESFCRIRRGSVFDPRCMPDELLRPYYDRFIATRLDEWVRRMKAFDPLAFYHSEDSEAFSDKVRGLRMPSTVICGREDRIGSWTKSLALVDMIEDVEFHVLSRCGHFPQLERPVALGALLVDFLGRTPEPAFQ
jgi:pimeloyl-ACP methyl ester carboxylesterase